MLIKDKSQSLVKALAVFVICLLLSVSVFAQNDIAVGDDAEKKIELPKQGRLAGTVSGGLGDLGAVGPWLGKDDSDEKAEAPLNASLNRNGDKWVLRVSNSSKDQYTASIKVTQSDASGRTVRSSPFSVSLRAGESTERTFRAHPSAANAVADLTRWSSKKKPSSEKEIEAEIQRKRAELEELEKKISPAGSTGSAADTTAIDSGAAVGGQLE